MRYYMINVKYKYLQTYACDGVTPLPEDQQIEHEQDRNFTVWAKDEQDALHKGVEQFESMAGSWAKNPLVEGTERFFARQMTEQEIAAMHGVFNK